MMYRVKVKGDYYTVSANNLEEARKKACQQYISDITGIVDIVDTY